MSLVKYTAAGVLTALSTTALFAVCAKNSLENSINKRSCDEQGISKVLDARLPTNGDTSYDKKTGLCQYKYIDETGQDKQFTWQP